MGDPNRAETVLDSILAVKPDIVQNALGLGGGVFAASAMPSAGTQSLAKSAAAHNQDGETGPGQSTQSGSSPRGLKGVAGLSLEPIEGVELGTDGHWVTLWL